jgi:hypothetical protein
MNHAIPKKPLRFITFAAALGANTFAQPVPPEGGQWTTLDHGLTFDWPSTTGLIPATGTIGKDEVLALLQEVDEGWDTSLFWDFRFLPLSKDKVYLLVFQVCRSGDCGFLQAVHCEPSRCFTAAVSALVNLNTDLIDVDGDGYPEIIAEECFDNCSGMPRLPTYLYSIYKFIDGTGFVDFSAQAAEYYRAHLLPKIEEARSTVKSQVAAASEEYRARAAQMGVPYDPGPIEAHKAAAAQYAYDDYRRRVLGERDAGLEDAISWAQSDYAGGLGLQALAHIPNAIAEVKLIEATKSKNPQLAEQASGLLRLRTELKARGALK